MSSPVGVNESTSMMLMARFRDGDEQAAHAMFGRYFRRLASLAHARLSGRAASRVDPEDVALSAYRSLFANAAEGRYALARSGDLWRLLSSIAIHKTLKRLRHERAVRRSYQRDVPLESTTARDPSVPGPETSIAATDEIDWLGRQLDSFGKRVLKLRLEGARLSEIADATGRSERSVRRALVSIRQIMAPRCPGTDPSATAHDLRSSRLPEYTDRDFLLRRFVGAGATGKVYEARSLAEAEDVAVKFLRKSLIHEPELVARFVGEARLVYTLQHDHIVRVHGVGLASAGAVFIVMELVRGGDLSSRLTHGPVNEFTAIDWILQVCRAIEHAHSRSVIHCDLKPANILLDAESRIKVTDFGLARALRPIADRAPTIEGTAPFMAPEQASPRWGQVDKRTDVYGIGAVLYAALTGRPPFTGSSRREVLSRVEGPDPVTAPIELRPEMSKTLSDICRRCLVKKPVSRFQNVDELRKALERHHQHS
jgi:tRNA A-37 threonylcarbamoyl transferase component Bud32/DNA-directed RNA polymerase specialized sigma24 family protein